MRVDGRNLGSNIRPFRSYQLKNSHHLPRDRFSDLERAESMARLERLSDVRAAVVSRGKALVANPDYPDSRIIRRIGELLASRLGG